MSEIVVIAVDGPAASGKGTLARRIAAELGYAYLDTGLLYRAIGLELLRDGEAFHAALNDEGGDATGGFFRIGLGVDDQRVGVR